MIGDNENVGHHRSALTDACKVFFSNDITR
jgi:hypothetical protein